MKKRVMFVYDPFDSTLIEMIRNEASLDTSLFQVEPFIGSVGVLLKTLHSNGIILN